MQPKPIRRSFEQIVELFEDGLEEEFGLDKIPDPAPEEVKRGLQITDLTCSIEEYAAEFMMGFISHGRLSTYFFQDTDRMHDRVEAIARNISQLSGMSIEDVRTRLTMKLQDIEETILPPEVRVGFSR